MNTSINPRVTKGGLYDDTLKHLSKLSKYLDNAKSGNQTRAILMQGECYNTTTPTLLIKSAKDYPKKKKRDFVIE